MVKSCLVLYRRKTYKKYLISSSDDWSIKDLTELYESKQTFVTCQIWAQFETLRSLLRHTWDVCETIAILVSGEPFVDFVKSLHFISCCLRVTLERKENLICDLQQWFFASLEDRSSTISDSDQRQVYFPSFTPSLVFCLWQILPSPLLFFSLLFSFTVLVGL